MTRGQLPQRVGSLGLNGGGSAAAVPPFKGWNFRTCWCRIFTGHAPFHTVSNHQQQIIS